MNEFVKLFEHIGSGVLFPVSQWDRCHVSFIIGAILARKPDDVLELGMGDGELSFSILKAMAYNGKGQLTCVDDGSLWKGKKTVYVETVEKDSSARIIWKKEEEFIYQCRDNCFDFMVANSDPFLSGFWVDEYFRVIRDGGIMCFHNTNLKEIYPNLQMIEQRLKTLGFCYFHFKEKSREDEYARGLLFAINDKIRVRRLPENSSPPIRMGVETNELGDEKGQPLSCRDDGDSQNILYLGLVSGKNYGWGVCSDYLIRELSEKARIHVLNDADGSAQNDRLSGKLFQALTSVQLFPMFEKAKGRENYGYTFFENELTEISIENSKRFDMVLGGSTWCRNRLLEKNIMNSGILIQGIDPELFYPIKEKKDEERFVIFSGGKFELRKGQDLVLKAFKILSEKYSDIYLVNCWYNIWPKSMQLMSYSKYISFVYEEKESWSHMMHRIYNLNGLDIKRIETLGLVESKSLRDLYKRTDVGVFPNRCEGGTNLVLMEYMACAKPVIASYTSGHKDIVSEENALLLRHLTPLNLVDSDHSLIGRWEDVNLDELVSKIEYAYHNKDIIRNIGTKGGDHLKNFTWKKSAEELLKLIG